MKISVLSGKGGTGKTTIATNLAMLLGWRYVDCDVEEPNGFIFLNPRIMETLEVKVPVPVIEQEKCILCKKCVEICQFHALGMAKDRVLVFEKLCHGCGACVLVCPTEAISETGRVIGKIDRGRNDKIECLRGVLNIGEPMSPPLIGALKKLIEQSNSILDCSPGSSCSVVKAIEGSDYALLVTEPTEFGLHDLKIAVSLVKRMEIPFGMIINRADQHNNLITNYCTQEGIPLIGIIPFEKEAARIYSEGRLLISKERYRQLFQDIINNLAEVMKCN